MILLEKHRLEWGQIGKGSFAGLIVYNEDQTETRSLCNEKA